MKGVGFYCRVYYYWKVSLRLGCEQRWWFTTLVLTRLSILCWENITDSYLDDCFSKPCSWEEGWFVWWSRKRIFQQRFIDTPLVLIKQTDCELLLNAALGKYLKSSNGNSFFFNCPMLFFLPFRCFSSTSDGVYDISKQTGIASSSSCFQYPAAPGE